MKMEKRPLILVEWDDITTDNPWQEEEDSPNWRPAHCISVGWRLKSKRGTLILVATRNEEGCCAERIVIPRGCVVKITKLTIEGENA